MFAHVGRIFYTDELKEGEHANLYTIAKTMHSSVILMDAASTFQRDLLDVSTLTN